jgi:hypothetical protein
MTKFKWLLAHITLTGLLTLLPLSSGSKHIVENLGLSSTLILLAKEFVNKEEQA